TRSSASSSISFSAYVTAPNPKAASRQLQITAPPSPPRSLRFSPAIQPPNHQPPPSPTTHPPSPIAHKLLKVSAKLPNRILQLLSLQHLATKPSPCRHPK